MPNPILSSSSFITNLYMAESPEAYSNSRSFPSPAETFHSSQPPRLLTPASMLERQEDREKSLAESRGLRLPDFVACDGSHFDADDIVYLKAKGVLDTPPLHIIVAAIQAFTEYIYPTLPIVDLHVVLESLVSNGRTGKLSLMLLYGIMLPGIVFMDESPIIEAGYGSRAAFARKISRCLRVDENVYLLGPC
jgi:hypothetical protein